MTRIPPPVSYTRSGDVNIAYQVIDGSGPDLIYVSGWVSNLDMMWDDPYQARFLSRLAEFGRLILFDKRGVGLSDRVPVDKLPTLEERMDDVRAVIEAVGSDEAFVFGHSEGSILSLLYAASYPQKTKGLILYGAYASRRRRNDYPWAPSDEERERFLDGVLNDWPHPPGWMNVAPSMIGDAEYEATISRYWRSAASPAAARALAQMNTDSDVRDILSAVKTPTLLLHRRGDRDASIGGARYMADRIPGAHLVELDGEDHLPWTEGAEDVLIEIEEFVTGERTIATPDRVLATVLFTDLVDSTARASAIGDRDWHELLDRHDAISVEEIARFGGTAVKGTGDGYLATFDGPVRAIRCAIAIVHRLDAIGLPLRAGIHAGEIELRGSDIAGIAVNIASRVSGLATSNEVLVSRTVKDLVAGSGLAFVDRGTHQLKGIEDKWQLFAASDSP